MGMSEALSDDGSLTGRGSSATRGLITGIATFIGGSAHALPFLTQDTDRALPIAYAVVSAELVAIAWVRRRFLRISLTHSVVQVTLGGAIVAAGGGARRTGVTRERGRGYEARPGRTTPPC